ncbi:MULTISPECIES: methyl-accepting chemotaxis protein [Burkholderia]|uniref:Methyl-accepting chemotaxis sensory transducer /methyl-accepting chemotaxis sensory transducer with TarH sensor n=1 Tax=Burkholderia pyrrocinia TaxID=60550 RepID=A0A318J684_BURPY|nr:MULTISPECIES: methyl-accepting chemotaxis protein [Burkholderia]PXX35099.1 methyl-accepting chemotaxis sensory transducer /methyl-accepting chemotaxis sensory transducer with TarH sensor [Burkholderia pyrrocinia]SFW66897.1 methyl-accepting chemotaxis sensory transducer /methyl-accepting chemotaxis sensory transducer with TarH sensor [Burkholderia sp. NFACC33-1]SFY27519.1 methyl-accepting chemotaxis sensory transducer /methyl-accepting chemotaxis sensory transducer with TarH sensor [Burkholder
MFGKIKLASGLLGVLTVFCLFLFAIEALGFRALASTRSGVDDLSNVAIAQVNAANQATEHLLDARINLSRAGTRMVRGGPKPEDIIRHAGASLADADKAFAALTAAQPVDDTNRARVAALAERYRALRGALGELVQFLDADNIQAFLDQPTQGIQDAYIAELHRFAEYGSASSRTALDTIDGGMLWFKSVGIALLVAMLAASAAIYAAARRAVVAPLDEASRHFERIAQGRLDEAVRAGGVFEIDRMLRGLAAMQTSIAGTVRTVRHASDAIHLGAGEIAGGNADLSARTGTQAASLEETAASMEELTATVRQNTDSARAASALADAALEATSHGGGVVDSVIDRMRGIAQSSGRIAEIISVIDGIAFQTNILALNAAVEAARAGEQGRGFAVVAGEVRSLAQRSAQSAKEIKALIEDSVAQINGGAELVERAGDAMRTVSASITRVVQTMSEITAASVEQSVGIEQVNQAVTQMDQLTQQNAALVEQVAAAAASLNDQTAHLMQAVSVFELGDARAARGERAAPSFADAGYEPAGSAA